MKPVAMTCIDVYNNNIISIQKGSHEMGILRNINATKVTENTTPNDLLNVLISEIHSIDIDRSLQEERRQSMGKNPLMKAPSQIRIFSVPDGPLGISVSSTPQDSVKGLKITDVDDLTYFAPGDTIASVNGVLLRELTPEFAVNILSESKDRHLTIIRQPVTISDKVSLSDCEPDDLENSSLAGYQEGALQTRCGPYHYYIKKMQSKFQANPSV